jgi:hypothetical protein
LPKTTANAGNLTRSLWHKRWHRTRRSPPCLWGSGALPPQRIHGDSGRDQDSAAPGGFRAPDVPHRSIGSLDPIDRSFSTPLFSIEIPDRRRQADRVVLWYLLGRRPTSPPAGCCNRCWWAVKDSNLRPADYSTTTAFAAPARWGLWPGPSHRRIPSPGRRRAPSGLYTFPSRGLARDCRRPHRTGSPTLTPCHHPVSDVGSQSRVSCSTN